MKDILKLMNGRRYAMTPNEIGRALGFHHGQEANRSNHAGRVMGPAQRVISNIVALRNRGLVAMTSRRDGLSGTAYALTKTGIDQAKLFASDKTKPVAVAGAKCGFTHLAGACDGPLYVAERYFRDGSSLYACECHMRKRQAMGATYSFRKVRS